MRAPLVAILAVVALLAGCLQPTSPADEDEAPAAGTPGVAIDAGRPDTSFSPVASGIGAPPDPSATLAEAPKLEVGEWWRIRFESPIDGKTAEFVRVVAAIDGDQYLVGMPHEGWYKEAVIYHSPAFGDVNVADLSYNTHNVLFTPLKFPLTDDQTWETRFSGGPKMTARVKVESDQVARVTFTSPDAGLFGTPAGADGEPNFQMELVYDASIHEVREFRHASATYIVLEHGYGFEGWITIPRGEDLVFFHGRFGPALTIGTFAPAAPVETVTVAGGFNRLTFIHLLSSVGGAPGAYRERTVAPDGTEFVTQALGPTGVTIEFYEVANPDGDWQFEHVAGGPGAAFIEGIAYHQYDIHLPSGLRRSDHAHEVVR